MYGRNGSKILENSLVSADIYMTTSGNKDIIMAHHMIKMKNKQLLEIFDSLQ
jgi:S-adenosylhomocysteine hydrolase